MGICFVWLFLAFILNDNPSAQAKLYPFLQGFSFSAFAIVTVLVLLTSKVKNTNSSNKKRWKHPHLVSS